MYIVKYTDNSGQVFRDEYIGSEKEIRDRMTREGKVVLELTEPFVLFQKRASNKEVYAVLAAMGELLKVGVPLSRAISEVISSVDRNSAMRGVLLTMHDAIREGKLLPDAMASYPQVFGFTLVSMVRAGIESGNLAQSLQLAAMHMKKIGTIKSQMIKKLTYPFLVLFIGMGSMAFNSIYVVPKLTKSDLFKMVSKGEVNVYIKALQTMTFLMPVFIVAVAVASFMLATLYKANQEKAEMILFRMALLRELVFYRGYYVTFFSMGNLIKAGVPMATALEIAANSTNLFTIKKEIHDALKLLREGESPVRAFRNLSSIERTMLEVAHNSERVHENMHDIANGFYDKYLAKVEALAPKIYALVMVFVIGMFLLTFLGIFMPYTKILGGIK